MHSYNNSSFDQQDALTERQGTKRKMCRVQAFPMAKPILSAEQVRMMRTWKTSVVDLKLQSSIQEEILRLNGQWTETAEANIYCKKLQCYDLMFHEASRLVHTKCPVTASFFYGLWRSIIKIAQHTQSYVLEDISIVRLTIVDLEVGLFIQ